VNVHAKFRRSPRDVQPRTTLTRPSYKEFPTFQFLVETIAKTIVSCGRFPKYLTNNSEYIDGLVDDAVTRYFGKFTLCGKKRTIRRRARKVARQIVHREWAEFRHYELVDGKRVRKSKSILRIEHPAPVYGEGSEPVTEISDVNGAGTGGSVQVYSHPLDRVEVDAFGRTIGTNSTNLNLSEKAVIAALDGRMWQSWLKDYLGPDDYFFMLHYLDRDEPATDAERQRFCRLLRKAKGHVTKWPS
jgi:hypothetical protein